MASKLDKNTLKGIRLNGQIIPSTTDNVQVQARYVQVAPNSEDLSAILGVTNITGTDSGGCANNLYDVLSSLSGKISTITQPLRFKGVINTGGSLPVKDVEVGDVYHFNDNIGSYYAGDEVVCINVIKGVEGIGGVQVQDEITWELLGRNTVDVTRIDPNSITIGNLESSSTI